MNIKIEGAEKRSKKAQHHEGFCGCKVCRRTRSLISFKEHYICEECVQYVKEHY